MVLISRSNSNIADHPVHGWRDKLGRRFEDSSRSCHVWDAGQCRREPDPNRIGRQRRRTAKGPLTYCVYPSVCSLFRSPITLPYKDVTWAGHRTHKVLRA